MSVKRASGALRSKISGICGPIEAFVSLSESCSHPGVSLHHYGPVHPILNTS